MSSDLEITQQAYWDQYWSQFRVPKEVVRTVDNMVLCAQLDVFDRFLVADPSRSILEIGGAPGQYLVYFTKQYGYKAHALDFSSVGCHKTQENFRLLGLEVSVYENDLFAEDLHLPEFDVVYSLGLVEHFHDLEMVVRKHIDLVKPGGLVVIGIPNLGGIYGLLLKHLAPTIMATHNLSSMNLNHWSLFEQSLGLEVLFRGYIGGFEPMLYGSLLSQQSVYEHETGYASHFNEVILRLFNTHYKARKRIYGYFPFLRSFRKINSKYWSACGIGVYRKR